MRRAHAVEWVRAAEGELMARLPEGTLMQRAAAGLAATCAELLRDGVPGRVYASRVLVLAGSGDNGGDALYAGARLARRGARVWAALLAPMGPPAAEGRGSVHEGGLAALLAAGGRVTDDPAEAERADLVLDGIVGIGGRGPLRDSALPWVRAAQRGAATVVAVDVPSGVAPDTGAVPGAAVRADVTVTFGTHKPGLLVDPGASYAGVVRLVDIGLSEVRGRDADIAAPSAPADPRPAGAAGTAAAPAAPSAPVGPRPVGTAGTAAAPAAPAAPSAPVGPRPVGTAGTAAAPAAPSAPGAPAAPSSAPAAPAAPSAHAGSRTAGTSGVADGRQGGADVSEGASASGASGARGGLPAPGASGSPVVLGGHVVEALQQEDVAALLPEPDAESDKYRRGVVGIAAGSARYPGAAVLAVGAALHGGVGAVRYAGAAAREVVRAHPEALVGEGGPKDAGRVQAWVVGPGLSQDAEAERAVAEALDAGVPVLVDADGLRLLARRGTAPADALLTPHAGEAVALLAGIGVTATREQVEAERLRYARELARGYGCTVLLKGSTTVVTGPTGPARVNATGTPQLATAGSGDVLSGLAGALLAAGLRPLDAGSVAAYLHGLAGRLSSDGAPTTATAITAALPDAWRRSL